MKNPTPSQDNFIATIEHQRDALATKFSSISSEQEMNVETAKLLKEIATIIKELDKLIKDDREQTQTGTNSFYDQIKQNSLLDTL